MIIHRDCCLFELLTYGGLEYEKLMTGMLNDDFFILQDKRYDFVYELRDSTDSLIGFASGTYIMGGYGVLLELFYLLPQYRGKHYFKSFLTFCINQYISVVLDRPNHYSILSLIKNGFAEIIDDWLVNCSLPLSFEEYDTVDGDVRRYSDYYDLRLSAIIDPVHKTISPLQDVDIDCFNAISGRDEYYTDNYWDDFPILVPQL